MIQVAIRPLRVLPRFEQEGAGGFVRTGNVGPLRSGTPGGDGGRQITLKYSDKIANIGFSHKNGNNPSRDFRQTVAILSVPNRVVAGRWQKF